MNNNNRGNNRRRGRGNNRPQGGGQQVNRVDSRARGNAPQMLEKYRKLAHDAHLNGDRVNEEYFLQFADHYFRVIADTRTRQEEQRRPRDERWQEQGDEGEDGNELLAGEYQGYEQGYGRSDRAERGNREDRPQEDRPREDRLQDDRPRDERPREDRPREDRPRDDRPRRQREPRVAEFVEPEQPAAVANPAEETVSPHEPEANPFLREARPTRGLKPRREDRRPRRHDDEGEGDRGGDNATSGLDASILPPAFLTREEPVNVVADEQGPADDEAPAPKRRGRKPKAAAVATDEG